MGGAGSPGVRRPSQRRARPKARGACPRRHPVGGVGALLAGNPEVVVLGPGVETEPARRNSARHRRGTRDVVIVLVADTTPELWQHASGPACTTTSWRPMPRSSTCAPPSSVRSKQQRGAGPSFRSMFRDTGVEGDHRPVARRAARARRRWPRTSPWRCAEHGDRVALVDLDLQFGDVSAALQLVPEHTLADVGRGHRASRRHDAQGLPARPPAGLYVLCARSRPPTRTRSQPTRPKRCDLSASTCRTSWSTPPPGSTRTRSAPSRVDRPLARLHPRRGQSCAACARRSTRSTRSA